MSTEPATDRTRKRVAVTVLLTDPGGRVLVVKPIGTPEWELPGGWVASNESPAAAATRGLAENLGIIRASPELLAVDYLPACDSRAEELNVVFDGGTLDDTAEFPQSSGQLSDTAFVKPDRLGDYLPEHQCHRARAALDARTDGRAVYLENGRRRGQPLPLHTASIGRWDPQDGIVYEVAAETLGDMIGLCSQRPSALEAADDADPLSRQLWLDLISFYARTRQELTLRDMAAVRAVTARYSPILGRIHRRPDA